MHFKRPEPKAVQSFQPPFTVQNSAAAVKRFPFPFEQKKSVPFRYSVNIEPHTPNGIAGSVDEFYFDIDEFYLSELAERERVLAKQQQHYRIADSARQASWELLARVTHQLSRDYPQYFELREQGSNWFWQNHLSNSKQQFVFGDEVSLGISPLLFIARTLPGDWVLLGQRNNKLFIDAGVVTGPAMWSLAEVFGMDFLQWHRPVPDEHQVFTRALKYLLHLPAAKPVRRSNWGLCVYPRLDMSLECQSDWRHDLADLKESDIGKHLNLRVEHQILERLPGSELIFFHIKTYFLTIDELMLSRNWQALMVEVLQSLPASITAYKGLSNITPKLLNYLTKHL